jgi:hypothetical protein
LTLVSGSLGEPLPNSCDGPASPFLNSRILEFPTSSQTSISILFSHIPKHLHEIIRKRRPNNRVRRH